MMQEFINFVQELFPSISPYTKEKIKDALKQFYISGKTLNCFMLHPLNELCQGDIVEDLPFSRYDINGNRSIFKTKGILLSNSCDAENDDTIVFAPLLPIDKINLGKNSIDNITKNLNYRLLYFPDHMFKDYVIDLSLLNSYNKHMIVNAISDGKIKRVASLSQFGYYLFLCKLTVHFFRPEDTGVQELRKLTV